MNKRVREGHTAKVSYTPFAKYHLRMCIIECIREDLRIVCERAEDSTLLTFFGILRVTTAFLNIIFNLISKI